MNFDHIFDRSELEPLGRLEKFAGFVEIGRGLKWAEGKDVLKEAG